MTAYYNENDPFAAAWLRELIKAGHVAPGDVDERSIDDVSPVDLIGYDQHHFFAGIGVWSHALRLAGWPDDRPVWTGSCPCQPFSAAGKTGGFADERHLWPAWFHLVDQWRPAVVLGEQVASQAGLGWLDLVSADMEAAGYAVGAADLCAAGVGAPHIRQRLWFVGLADASGERRNGQHPQLQPGRPRQTGVEAAGGCEAHGLADADDARPQGRRVGGNGAGQRPVGAGGVAGGLADANSEDQGGRRIFGPGQGGGASTGAARQRSQGLRADGGLADAAVERSGRQPETGRQARPGTEHIRIDGWPGAVDGFWRDADWLHCRDGKWRPVEPGTFPLASGLAGRVGLLRGYGNSLNAEVAKAFIETVMDIL